MEARSLTREVRLRAWAEMVSNCRCSGKSVKAWCAENGIHKKTYYYRQSRVQKAALAVPVSDKLQHTPQTREAHDGGIEFADIGPGEMMFSSKAPVTVRINGMSVEIDNGADSKLIVNVFRALRDVRI
jgi:hypothetical protein